MGEVSQRQIKTQTWDVTRAFREFWPWALKDFLKYKSSLQSSVTSALHPSHTPTLLSFSTKSCSTLKTLRYTHTRCEHPLLMQETFCKKWIFTRLHICKSDSLLNEAEQKAVVGRWVLRVNFVKCPWSGACSLFGQQISLAPKPTATPWVYLHVPSLSW